MTAMPCCTAQRSTTWAGLIPRAAAMPVTTADWVTWCPPPSGDQACGSTPAWVSQPTMASRGSAGDSSIWSTAGVTPVASISAATWAGLKLDTPTDRISPSAASSSMAWYDSTYRPSRGSGQWIRYRSR